MNELICLKILYLIRQNSGIVSLKELLHLLVGVCYGSYYKYDFHPLIALCNEKYISIMNYEKKDISKSVCQMDYDDVVILFNSALYHAKDTDNIFIMLTSKLSKIQSLLGFSLSDTIKKFDNNFSVMITPIFNQPDFSIKSDVFVIMPFQEEFDYLYQNYIKTVCKRINVSCMRADDLYSSKPIMQDIWSLIYNSKVIIADCSTKNPNVMYELGIAHAIGKEVILITQDVNDIPFDLRHLHHLQYKYTPHSINLFEDDLEYTLYPYFK